MKDQFVLNNIKEIVEKKLGNGYIITSFSFTSNYCYKVVAKYGDRLVHYNYNHWDRELRFIKSY